MWFVTCVFSCDGFLQLDQSGDVDSDDVQELDGSTLSCACSGALLFAWFSSWNFGCVLCLRRHTRSTNDITFVIYANEVRDCSMTSTMTLMTS